VFPTLVEPGYLSFPLSDFNVFAGRDQLGSAIHGAEIPRSKFRENGPTRDHEWPDDRHCCDQQRDQE
jgi:hypothetical protein